jgi:hypothetical protein
VLAKRKRVSCSPKAGHAEQDGEGGGERRVDLLAGVEPSLGRLAAAQPAEVVAVELLELARGCEQPAGAEQDDCDERAEPGDASPEVDALDELPARDQLRQPRQVEDQPRREQEEEADRVHPVE